MSSTATPMKNKDGMPDNEHQFYETPIAFVRHAMGYLNSTLVTHLTAWPPTILDAGAGNGVWGKVAREIHPSAKIIGCELRTVPKPDEYDEWHQRDFVNGQKRPFWYEEYADMVIGNPPFWCINYWLLATEVALRPGGIAWLLAPLNIFCGEARHQLLYTNWKPEAAYPIPQRMSFYNNGRTDAREYAMYFFRKGYNPEYIKTYPGKMSWYESKAPLSLKGRQKKVKKPSSVEAQQLELISEVEA